MQQYLNSDYHDDIEVYPDNLGRCEVITIKGTDAEPNLEIGESCIVEIEFLPETMDSYLYLFLELERGLNGWTVKNYGLEM